MNTALIFAAGRGERFKSFTNHTPKVLYPINHRPLIEYHLIHLKQAGFSRILINHAYLGDQIKRHLGNGARFDLEIIYLPEPPGALESAGGILNARPYLDEEFFLTLNADIYTDYDFSNIRCHHLTHHAHLVLVPHTTATHSHPDFGYNRGLVSNEQRAYTFSGIACYQSQLFHGQLFHDTPRRAQITPWLRTWADQQQVSGEIYQGQWFDIGSPERLQFAEHQIRPL